MKLYNHIAPWWHLFSAPEDYLDEATFFHQTLIRYSLQPLRTLLELGSGGGNNASHLKSHFELTLVDLSPEMLKVSAALNPECRHIQGDMRTVRPGQLFDAIFIHDAIMYMTSEQDLRMAIETAFLHCKPGGVALLAPDHTRETFEPETKHGGDDGGDRAIRYLEWSFDPDPTDTSYKACFAYMLREEDGSVRYEHEEHLFGLFERAVWVRLMTEAGFDPKMVKDSYGRDIFVGLKPQ